MQHYLLPDDLILQFDAIVDDDSAIALQGVILLLHKTFLEQLLNIIECLTDIFRENLIVQLQLEVADIESLLIVMLHRKGKFVLTQFGI